MKLHMHLHLALCVFALAALMATQSAGAAKLYETGFEAREGFVANQVLNGQGGWVSSDQATVLQGGAQAGDQYVSLPADSSIEKSLAGQGSIWLVGYYKGAGTNGPASYPADITTAACILHFSATDGIQALTKNGGGAETWVPADPASALFTDENTWTKIALNITYNQADPSLATWSVFIDGQLYLRGLKFRDPITALNGFRGVSSTQSGFDSFSVMSSNGDVDGDGFSDEGEIAADTDPLDSASYPRDLFDLDGDGQSTILDAILHHRITNGQIAPGTKPPADVNGDGIANEDDSMLIYRWALGDPAVPFLPTKN